MAKVKLENVKRNARIVAMRKGGMWPFQIAEHLGLSRNTVIGALNRAGLSSKETDRGQAMRDKCLRPEVRREIAARHRKHDRQNGCAALAREYGVNHLTVATVIKRERRA